MHTHVVSAILAACALTTAAAQTSTPPASPSQAPAKGANPLVLVGCVTADQANADRLTVSDPRAGVTYRLRGLNVAAYSGRRVRIIGGLYPSPNIAAQAGAIDPTKAAMAAAGATGANITGMGTAEPLEFHIARVRPLPGSCPPR